MTQDIQSAITCKARACANRLLKDYLYGRIDRQLLMAQSRRLTHGPNPKKDPYWYVQQLVGYWLAERAPKHLGVHAQGPLALLCAVSMILDTVIINHLPTLDQQEYRNALRTYAERKLGMQMPVHLVPEKLIPRWEGMIAMAERKQRVAGAEARAMARRNGWA